ADPVMQYVKYSSLPILWNRSVYERAGEIDKWEWQASHGLANGIAGALHMRDGRALVLGFTGDDPLPDDRRAQTALTGRFLLFLAHLEAAYSRIYGWPLAQSARKTWTLTGRELECLR